MEMVTCQWKEVSVLFRLGGLRTVCAEEVCVAFLMWWVSITLVLTPAGEQLSGWGTFSCGLQAPWAALYLTSVSRATEITEGVLKFPGATRTQEGERSRRLFFPSTLHHDPSAPAGLGSTYGSRLLTEVFGREMDVFSFSRHLFFMFMLICPPDSLALPSLSSTPVAHQWVCWFDQLSKKLAGILNASLPFLQAPPIGDWLSGRHPSTPDFNLSKKRATFFFH